MAEGSGDRQECLPYLQEIEKSEKGARKQMSDAKPISQRKLKANRRNASRSTGPKTPEGKSIARWNAWKHGLHSQKLLLPGEKESDWLAFREQLSDGLKPVGELELLLADRITMLAWRIRRLSGLESGVFVWNYYKIIADRNWAGYTLRDFPETQELHEKESVPEKEAVSKYREAEAQQESQDSTLGHAFIRESERADSFVKLSRYEGRLERSFYQALQEFHRLQAARAGGPGSGLTGEGGSKSAHTTRRPE